MPLRLTALATLIVVTSCTTATASPPCGKWTNVTDGLRTHFAEDQIWWKIHDSGNLAEVWYSRKKNTYSLLMTSPGGNTCVVQTGRAHIPPKGGQEDT